MTPSQQKWILRVLDFVGNVYPLLTSHMQIQDTEEAVIAMVRSYGRLARRLRRWAEAPNEP